jgi:hypothetical protein
MFSYIMNSFFDNRSFKTKQQSGQCGHKSYKVQVLSHGQYIQFILQLKIIFELKLLKNYPTYLRDYYF